MKMENINQHGIGSEIIEPVISGDIFSEESIKKNINRLTNQMWKLIPMRENNENWEKQLDTVTLEIAGLNEIFSSNPSFLNLLVKLKGLRVEETNFSFYRKTVFECLSLLQEMKK